MQVRDVMTRDVISVQTDSSLREAAQILAERRISGLPVTDQNGEVVGVVSEADFVNAAGRVRSIRPFFARWLDRSSSGPEMRDTTVASVMTSPARTIEPDRPVAEAAARMARWNVNRLPVCENGELIGIISRADVVSLYARSDDELASAVADALAGIEGLAVERVQDGLVVLAGTVSHRALSEAARATAGQVEGVIAVDMSGVTAPSGFGTDD
jgi:CBS domain-containing protein